MYRTLTSTRIALAAVFTSLIAAPAAGQSDRFALRGIIRDFRSTHPDFGPAVGPGHFPANVSTILGADGKPLFTGAGYEALDQWRDRLARPIAPHMWNDGRVFVQVASAPSLDPGTVADSYDSDAGPYDPATAGPAPEWLTGSPMPTVIVPSLDVVKSGNFYRNGAGTTVLSGDLHVEDWEVRDLHVVKLSGYVRIVVDGSFLMRDGAQLQLEPGAQCDLYILGSAAVYDTIIGGPQQTHRIRIHYTGTTDFRFGDGSHLYGHVTSPSADLLLQDGSDFFGQVRSQSVTLENMSGLHIDDMPNLCGIKVEDTAGTGGGAGGGITSRATFMQWFEDVLGVNVSRNHTIVLHESSGTYEYDSDGEFFPIDGKCYGNDGDPHNYYFTYEIPATFTYNACTGQGIWFEGDDDCWIFIDDRLVIDLGGVTPGVGQFIELDRMRLKDGQTYNFRLFYAHRHAGPAHFNLRTNFELVPEPVESGIALSAAHD